MPIKDENGNWIDGTGKPVPEKYVPAIAKKREKIVEKIHSKAIALRARMMKDKQELILLFEQYEKEMMATHKIKAGGEKGNLTIRNFRGDKWVERSSQEYVDFDENLQVAIKKIQSCVDRWSKDVTNPLKPLVLRLIKPDKKGRLAMKGLRSLCNLDISDPEWEEARDLIRKSEVNLNSKYYYRVYEREHENDDKINMILLDFASM